MTAPAVRHARRNGPGRKIRNKRQPSYSRLWIEASFWRVDISPGLAHNAGMTVHTPLALALFSGGLDSILAARLILAQNIPVRCLHFVSPFFGNADLVPHWEQAYGLSITAVDIGDAFVRMLRARPEHGYGKVMNPCVDCKILMLRTARDMMEAHNAAFVISGEVLGQRPMSQRRDALNLIRRETGLGGRLLRPLSALHLPPTLAEEDGSVDRTRLLGLFGRGRKDQLQLAKDFGLTDIPTPAGGCRLAERENARRYWPVLTRLDAPTAADFHLANIGRQAWAQSDPSCWMSVGRNQADNDALFAQATPADAVFKVADIPGPVGLGRLGAGWSPAMRADAAAFVASFAPKALALTAQGETVAVRVTCNGHTERVVVTPARETPAAWQEEAWDNVRAAVRSINQDLNRSHHPETSDDA